MEKQKGNIFIRNKNILFIAIATALILTVPFLAMQLNWQVLDPGSSTENGVNWTASDFILAGTLLFGTGLAFEIFSRKVKNVWHRIAIGILLAVILLYLWAELSVGIFFNFGS